jgi:hypothetical protein
MARRRARCEKQVLGAPHDLSMKHLLRSFLAVAAGLLSPSMSADGNTTRAFSAECWGVYSWGSTRQVTRQTHPLIKGVPTILRWSEVEPEPGVFRFEEVIGDRLKHAEANGFYTFLKLYVAPHPPRWLYQNGVPELQMTPTINPLGKPRDWTFQHYLDEDYIRFYHRLLTAFCTYVRDLSPAQRGRILFIQSAEGSTGDGGPYKGQPLEPEYHITDEQWGRFRIKAWEVMAKALTGESGKPVVPLLVNYDSNREEHYRWLLENLPVLGLKNGMFSHGYHISDTRTRLRNWQKFVGDVKAAGKEFFSRGEQDGEYRVYGWSAQNIPQGLYWSALFALHCGIDMWNLPNDACAGHEHEDAIRFFNKYAGRHEAASSPAAFCALRKGLDASDVAAYPESVYGKAEKSNVDRYLKIAEAFKAFGAIQGDPPKAIGGGMLNRRATDHNDVGWEIADGNFEVFLTQIDPDKTSLGWWQKGPKVSIYSRFARSTDIQNGKRMLYFDLNDAFLGNGKAVEVRIVWLDEGKAEWKLHYNAAGDPQKTALTITNTASGEWKEKTVVLSDFLPQNKGPSGADLHVECDGRADLVLHLIEVTKQ